MEKVVNTLYSEFNKKIILAVHHCVLEDVYTEEAESLDVVLSVVSGSGKIVFENGEEILLSAGDGFLFASGRKYCIECETPMEVFLLKLNFGDFITGQFIIMNRETIGGFFDTMDKINDKINGIHINARRIKDAVYMIEHELENQNNGSEYVVRAYIALLISLVVQYYSIDGGRYGSMGKSLPFVSAESAANGESICLSLSFISSAVVISTAPFGIICAFFTSI